MTGVLAAGHLLLGAVYLSYGAMTLAEMVRARQRLGFSHFGLAWVLMTLTCGPHHLEHGLHLATGRHPATAVDGVTLAVSLVPGLVWFRLRVEAFRGGSGDRHVAGTPWWVQALPSAAAAYLTALLVLAVGTPLDGDVLAAVPSLVLLGLYLALGWLLVRTQLGNRDALGGWSLSGISLAAVFPTCAVTHAVYAFQVATGAASSDAHLLAVSLFGIPATAYFLWVVRLLQTGRYREWNVIEDALPAR
jgi:hypothetical protein